MTAPPPDEFDAAKIISETLKPFKSEEQIRMLRWVAEKHGLTLAAPFAPPPNMPPAIASIAAAGIPLVTPELPAQPSGNVDIKSFVATKKPKSDTQFATVVAYYYRFEAKDKRDAITAADLTEACRLANHDRLSNPGQTLLNSVRSGVLDKAARGAFSINTVGENLVAITLPGDGSAGSAPIARRRRGGKASAKKPASKPAPARKSSAKKALAKTATPKKK